MQCVTKFLKARVFLTLACALTVLLPGTCIAESTATRMQKVVEKFVNRPGTRSSDWGPGFVGDNTEMYLRSATLRKHPTMTCDWYFGTAQARTPPL
jgi:hypothetical protein